MAIMPQIVRGSNMRRKLLLVIGWIVVISYFGFLWKASQNPEAQRRTLSLVRDIPANIFYPVFIGFTVLVLGPVLWILVNQKRWSQMATSGSIRNAKKMALSLWYVDGTMAETKKRLMELEETAKRLGYKSRKLLPEKKDEDLVVVRFRHMSFGRWKVTLPVRPGHPDIDKFRHLKTGDTVEFEALSEGMECALDHELCGFLRIKSVS